MPSKQCSKCKRIVTCNHIPQYCPWGCGSLKEQPLLASNTDELLEYLRNRKESEANNIKIDQLKLF